MAAQLGLQLALPECCLLVGGQSLPGHFVAAGGFLLWLNHHLRFLFLVECSSGQKDYNATRSCPAHVVTLGAAIPIGARVWRSEELFPSCDIFEQSSVNRFSHGLRGEAARHVVDK